MCVTKKKESEMQSSHSITHYPTPPSSSSSIVVVLVFSSLGGVFFFRGHAYEATTTDVIARYQRLIGDKACYFLTGTDEHGQKIANTASDLGKQPIDICDLYATGFQVLNQRILISNDDYVRTTSERHKRNAKALWNKCAEAGDIYLDTYSGW